MTFFNGEMLPPDLPRRYPHDHLRGMTDEDWRRIPATRLRVASVEPSQEAVSLVAMARLVNGGDDMQGGDGMTIRVVQWGSRLYAHDGNTRWLYLFLRGEPWLWARVVVVPVIP